MSLRTKTAACAANISPACYHFAAVQCYWSTMISMIYCPVLKSLQPQLPLLSFTASTSFWPSLFWKLFSLERGRPCECVQQCWSQQDEWNRGPSFPSFISKLWLNSYIIYYDILRHSVQHKKHVETVECSRTKAPLSWQLSFVPASWTQS